MTILKTLKETNMNLGTPELILILFIIILFSLIYVIPFWRILKRTGFSPGFSFLALVPIVKLIALYYFAFTEWPSTGESKKTE
jgi:hypothetical protein